TFAEDLVDPDRIDRQLVRMADAVAGRLRSDGIGGRTVTVKVRYPDFRTITRSVTRPQALDTVVEILGAGRALLAGVDLTPGVRLLGIHVSGLSAGGPRQLELGLESTVEGPDGEPSVAAPVEDWQEASAAVDE